MFNKKEIALLMFSKSFLLISICFVNNILVVLKLNEELKSELDFATYFISEAHLQSVCKAYV